jgi:septum formation protein
VTPESIVLASASPRRRELLQQIGVVFEVIPAHIDETPGPHESPAEYTRRMAREKALAVAGRQSCGRPVLGADTSVIIDGEILGKPDSPEQAAAMLRRLSGRTHQVLSAVAVVAGEHGVLEALSVSQVTFAPLDQTWIAQYVRTGDPMDKAGAYGVQGMAGEKISRIEGSFYGVMGLPLYETAELLRRVKVIS